MQQNGMFLNFNIYKKFESSKKGLQQIHKIELKEKINLHKLKNIINTKLEPKLCMDKIMKNTHDSSWRGFEKESLFFLLWYILYMAIILHRSDINSHKFDNRKIIKLWISIFCEIFIF
jgi:hypothetical protein